MAETKIRIRAETFADHYSQARLFFRSQSEPEQAHLASAIVFELSKVTLDHIRLQVIANLRNVDENLAKRVTDGLGLDKLPPKSPAAAKTIDMDLSPALRIVGKYPETLKGRMVGILVADGTDAALVDEVKTAVKKAGAKTKVIGPKINVKMGGKLHAVDAQLAGSPSVIFDAVALILSKEGAETLAKDGAAVDFVKDAFGHLKAIGHTAECQALMNKAGVETDAGIVVLKVGSAGPFIAQAKTRQWDREPTVRMLA